MRFFKSVIKLICSFYCVTDGLLYCRKNIPVWISLVQLRCSHYETVKYKGTFCLFRATSKFCKQVACNIPAHINLKPTYGPDIN